MKKAIITIFIILFLGGIGALGYVLYQNGLISVSPSNETDQTADSEEEETDNERDLGWMNEIPGYSEEDEPANDTIEEEEENDEDTSTTTEDGLDEEDSEKDGASMEEETTIEEEEPKPSTDPDRERGVENLGKGDALESTVYDHAFDKLILFASMTTDSVELEWNASDSDQFDGYVIVRSMTDENPYYPTSQTIQSFSNINRTSYTDTSVKSGIDYYYRVCFKKKEGRPGCGNILKVMF
ncbi:hypothetical protein GF380_04625 [Candidatus Uhrbacteria bacterium]|nr:hypothetical protein [Candidatus Uhrbacteria bacterium]MBD3284340.1 hypothetical protein [Candidatus Uhrbacteria bacterium]